MGIHFLDFRLYPQLSDWEHCFEFLHKKYPTICYTEQMRLFLFELPKIKTDHQPLEQWLYFLKHAESEVSMSDRQHYSHAAILNAFETLEDLSQDSVYSFRE